ncbi:glycosyltransferase [Microbacterium sp.]|uniref:glycosyltransferase n=1 Tax=Microbacterium sp. TaxID=51671 RepID=UPI0037367CB2
MTAPRVLFLSHSHTFGPFRVGSHHYAREWSRLGAQVVHLSTPISLLHRLTRRMPSAAVRATPRRPQVDEDGVTHMVPRTVLPRPLGGFRVHRELERAGIAPTFDAVLIDQPLLWDDSVRDLSDRLVYRPTDLYPAGVKRRLQAGIIARADAVVATSGRVLHDLGPLDVPSLVIENGVDLAHFAGSGEDADGRPAICVYVGALDTRFDWARVIAWAGSHSGIRFVVAGPSAHTPARLPDNVDVLGALPYAKVPDLLHRARVGLLPLSDDPSNAGRSPMKLHEYLAAGLTVVARETPGIRDDREAGVFTYSSDAAADAALTDALTHASPNNAGRRMAERHGWTEKTRELAGFIGGL